DRVHRVGSRPRLQPDRRRHRPPRRLGPGPRQLLALVGQDPGRGRGVPAGPGRHTVGVANVPPPGKHPCLAVFDPLNNLQVTRTTCGPQVTIDPTGLVSPDGRWLAAWSMMDTQPPPECGLCTSPGFATILVRLDTVFTNPVVSQTWTGGTGAG